MARIKNEAQEKIKPKDKKSAADAEEFDFGAGFEKFATGQQKIDGDNNLDGFDFGGSDAKQQDKDKDDDEFEFNFGGKP